MNPTPQRADPLSSFVNEEPLELSSDQMIPVEPSFDQQQWTESQTEARGAGGRQVLGTSLVVIAALWLAYTAWSGRPRRWRDSRCRRRRWRNGSRSPPARSRCWASPG